MIRKWAPRVFAQTAVLALAVSMTACSGEKPVPFDLGDGNVVDPEAVDVEVVDPNAESRALSVAHAEQQCLDDNSLEIGVIQIASADTGEVMAEVTADCSDVEARQASGEPVGLSALEP